MDLYDFPEPRWPLSPGGEGGREVCKLQVPLSCLWAQELESMHARSPARYCLGRSERAGDASGPACVLRDIPRPA